MEEDILKVCKERDDFLDRMESYFNRNIKLRTRDEVNWAIAIVLQELTGLYFKILDQCREIEDVNVAESASGQSSIEFMGIIRNLSELLETIIEAPYSCVKCDADVNLLHNHRNALLSYFIKWLFLDKNIQVQRSLSEWEELVDWYFRPCLTYKCGNEKCGYTDLICFVNGYRNEWGYLE